MIDAEAALALQAQIYRQLTETQARLAEVTAELVALRGVIRDDVGLVGDGPAAQRS